MDKKILFRAIVEVLGKPKEHIEQSIQNYVEKLKQDENYKVVAEEFAEAKKQDKTDLWVCFVELEVEASSIEDLTSFCFDYMPSLIEIIEPKELCFADVDVSKFLNDLQAKLHNVDMVAKQIKMENDGLKKSMGILLRNYTLILLRKERLTGEQLSQFTGVDKDRMGDFLDKLIDEKVIDLEGELYYIKESS